MYKNSEGYPDPTAGAALEHIEYEERLKRKKARTSKYKIATKGLYTIYYEIQTTQQNNLAFKFNPGQC